MNNELKFDLKRLKLLYYTYRYSPYYAVFAPAVSIVVFVLVLWLFFIPEMQSWFSIRNEVEATQQRIKTARSNLQYLELLGDAIVENDFIAASSTLPPEKDFAAIIAVISESANNAQVQVDDFSFILGEVSQGGTAQPDQIPAGIKDEPIAVSFGVSGSTSDVNTFIKEIEANVPLSELKALDFTDGKAQVRLNFYSKAFPDVMYTDTTPIETLTTDEKNLLLKLRGWQ